MKMQFLFFAMTVGYLSLSAQSPEAGSALKNDFPQTVNWSYWDDGWKGEKTVTYTYNPIGLPLVEVWDFTAGTDVRITYSYTSDNLNQTLKLRQEKTGGLWAPISRQRAEYDSNGRKTLTVSEKYTTGVWMIESGFQYQPEYLDGRLYKETTLSFNPADGYYHPSLKWTYTWDQAGLPKIQTCESFSEAGVWVWLLRKSLYWDHDNRPDYVLSDIWNLNQWIPYSKEMHAYYGIENHAESLYIWREDLQVYTAWQRLVSEYDEKSNLILSTIEEWKGTGWQVLSGEGYQITYNNGHATERITEKWDPGASEASTTGGRWLPASREVFSDFLSLGNPDIVDPEMQVHCYPNPVKQTLFIECRNYNNLAGDLLIRDIQGKILIRQKIVPGESAVAVDVSRLPSGIYWLTISNGFQIPFKYIVVKQ